MRGGCFVNISDRVLIRYELAKKEFSGWNIDVEKIERDFIFIPISLHNWMDDSENG